MPGPAPKPNARRPNNGATKGLPSFNQMLVLPSEGRKGRPPAFPLRLKPLKGQTELWADLWSTPQAVAWERLGWTRIVGRYCRLVLVAEVEMDAKFMAEARQLEDRLGLTPMAMLRLRWRVADDELDAKRRPLPARRPRSLKAVAN